MKNNLKIHLNAKTEYISPDLHGQFIEHLGSCINGGLWVGENSDIPNAGGIRLAALEALAEVNPPVMRWPGGCFADMYHWEDGIGPREKRPVTFNSNFGTNSVEENGFGTHEFIELCEKIGAKPWININMLSGSVRKMVEWAEYCNRPKGSVHGDRRAGNGADEPFNVLYWGIGNEAWAGGGNFTAEGYADAYRRYSSAFPPFFGEGEPSFRNRLPIKLVGVGPDGNKPAERVEWTTRLCKAMGEFRAPKMDAYDLHFYNWNSRGEAGTATEFSEEQWYILLSSAQEIEPILLEQYALLSEFYPKSDSLMGVSKPELIIGEWGNWHGFNMGKNALWQQNTMRDAVTAALTLDIFHRNCDKVKMACLAQSVNVLGSLILTDGAATILTPTYHVFKMYLPHRGANRLDTATESRVLYSGVTDVTAVTCFASEKDGIVTVNAVNSNMTACEELVIEVDGALEFVSSTKLAAVPTAHNTADNLSAVVPEQGAISAESGVGFTLTLDPASVNVFTFKKI